MRAGRDVYSINHCGRHVTGYLSDGDKILRVYRRNLRYYQVLLNNNQVLTAQPTYKHDNVQAVLAYIWH